MSRVLRLCMHGHTTTSNRNICFSCRLCPPAMASKNMEALFDMFPKMVCLAATLTYCVSCAVLC